MRTVRPSLHPQMPQQAEQRRSHSLYLWRSHVVCFRATVIIPKRRARRFVIDFRSWCEKNRLPPSLPPVPIDAKRNWRGTNNESSTFIGWRTYSTSFSQRDPLLSSETEATNQRRVQNNLPCDPLIHESMFSHNTRHAVRTLSRTIFYEVYVNIDDLKITPLPLLTPSKMSFRTREQNIPRVGRHFNLASLAVLTAAVLLNEEADECQEP